LQQRIIWDFFFSVINLKTKNEPFTKIKQKITKTQREGLEYFRAPVAIVSKPKPKPKPNLYVYR
jgi:hypothetical protein